jgi:hypothetical protein
VTTKKRVHHGTHGKHEKREEIRNEEGEGEDRRPLADDFNLLFWLPLLSVSSLCSVVNFLSSGGGKNRMSSDGSRGTSF